MCDCLNQFDFFPSFSSFRVCFSPFIPTYSKGVVSLNEPNEDYLGPASTSVTVLVARCCSSAFNPWLFRRFCLAPGTWEARAPHVLFQDAWRELLFCFCLCLSLVGVMKSHFNKANFPGKRTRIGSASPSRKVQRLFADETGACCSAHCCPWLGSGEQRWLCPVLITVLMGLRLSLLLLAAVPSSRVPWLLNCL